MTSTLDELLRDPLFQLNAVLWLAQPLPGESQVTPLFHNKGFTVYAIAPLLALPPDVQLAAQEARVSVQPGVRPDVVLIHEREGRFAFAECKGGSFRSSAAEQARSLLIVAGPRAAEVLGLAGKQVSSSLLALVTPESERLPWAEGLTELLEKLREAHLPVGEFSVLGLVLTDTDISLSANGMGAAFFGVHPGLNTILGLEPDTDPRPLYFIPYDPDVMQSADEQALCRRILFERMHSTVVAGVGRAHPPADLSLESNNILNDAMLGMYGQWENRDSARHMRRLCRQFMEAVAQAVHRMVPGTMVYQPGVGWKITIRDEDQHDKLMDALTRFSCETLDLQAELVPTLFDGPEGDAPKPC